MPIARPPESFQEEAEPGTDVQHPAPVDPGPPEQVDQELEVGPLAVVEREVVPIEVVRTLLHGGSVPSPSTGEVLPCDKKLGLLPRPTPTSAEGFDP